MAVKRTLNRDCPKCGSQQVKRRGSRIWYSPCLCNPVPGPQPVPVEYGLGDVLLDDGTSPSDLPESVLLPPSEKKPMLDRVKGLEAELSGMREQLRFTQSDLCLGCGKTLHIDNAWMEDGCPCNSDKGVNNRNLHRWDLLHQLQQRQASHLGEVRKQLSETIRDKNPDYDTLIGHVMSELNEANEAYDGCYAHNDSLRKKCDKLTTDLEATKAQVQDLQERLALASGFLTLEQTEQFKQRFSEWKEATHDRD